MTKRSAQQHIAQLGPAHPNRGGIVHFNNRLALALQARPDLKVHQYFWTRLYPKCLLPRPADAWIDKQSRISFQVPGQYILNYANPLSWLALVRRMRTDGCRVLITHWVHPVHFPVFLVLFAFIRCFTDIKIHLIVHNAMPHEPFIGATLLTRAIMNLAHHIVVHSSSDLDIVCNKLKISNKAKLAYHPIYDFFIIEKNPEFPRRILNLEKKIFLFFGFIRPYKGLECLISAFEILQEKIQDASLLIVGKNLYLNKDHSADTPQNFLWGRIKNNGKIIHIDEYVPNEEVGKYFSIASALITPYVHASQSGPVHIASAFGKPVIASDLPSFRECIEPEVTGCFFKPGDPQDLADAMEHALNHDWDPVRIQEHGRMFDWGRYVQILLDDDNDS